MDKQRRQYQRHKWQKPWSNIEDPVVLVERNLYGHPLAGTIVRTTLLGCSVGTWMGKIQNWECVFGHRKQGLCFSVYADDIKMAGKKQNMGPTWKKLMKNVELDAPTSFLDHVFLGCTQRECEPNKRYCGTVFESRIFDEATENYEDGTKTNNGVVLWHGRTCRKVRWKILRIGKQGNRAIVQSFKFFAWIIIMSRRRNLNQMDNYQNSTLR